MNDLTRPAPSSADRPAIAIVSNSQTPYRLHLHRRIARELPEIRLWSVYTHEVSNAPWAFEAPEEIGPVLFGKGESCEAQADPKNAIKEWRRGGRIIRWMKEHDVRFVVMMGYNDAGRVRMIRWCRRAGVPCYLFGDSNIKGDFAAGVKGVIKKAVVTRVVKWCSGVLSCGRLGREYFARYGAEPGRSFYFPYEPDYDLIQHLPPETVEQVRQRFGLSRDRRRVVFSGRLTAFKRPELLIDAFASIAADRPDWDLLVIGDGPLGDSLRGRLPERLMPRATWTGFLDDQAIVSALYLLSDVLVLPSDYEPWALVINEAVAAGMAVVSSDVVGAAAELVRDGVNGRLFPPGDGPALADCLKDVTDSRRIDGMKAASREVLADWRRSGDPVDGLRNAMRASGISGV